MDEQRLANTRTMIHPVIAILIPFLFLWTLYAVLGTVIKVFSEIPGIFPLLLFLVGVAETVVGNYLYKEKVGGFFPRLRELFVILVLSFLLLLLLTGDLFQFEARNLLRLRILFPMVCVIFSWSFTYFVHQKLRDRELFLKILMASSERDLTKTFREYHFEAGQTSDGLHSIRRLTIGFQIVIFVLVLVGTALEARITAAVGILVIVHFVFGLIFVFSTNSMLQSQGLYGEGYLVPGFIQSRRFWFAVLAIIVGCLIMIPIVGDQPPMPSSILANLMAWLREKLTLKPVEITAKGPELRFSDIQDDAPKLPSVLLEGEIKKRNENLQNIIRTIIIALLIGIPSVAFLIALIAPLFRRSGGKVHPLLSLWNWFSRFWGSIATAIRNMRSSFRKFKKRSTIKRSLLDNLFGGGRSEEDEEDRDKRPGFLRRLTLARNIKIFLRLIRWGEKKGARFAACLGPKEYLGNVGLKVPDIRQTLEEIADLFEEQLFSTHEITDEKNSEYYSKVRLVLKTR